MTAAFQATYADFKTIKSRSVVQIVLEVPVEQADHALKVLGGVPKPGESVWVGVARMAAQKPEPPPPAPTQGEGGKEPRKFPDLPASQQAALKCQDADFQQWLAKYLNRQFADDAGVAQAVRGICGVVSRAQLDIDREAATRWKQLLSQFEDARLGRR